MIPPISYGKWYPQTYGKLIGGIIYSRSDRSSRSKLDGASRIEANKGVRADAIERNAPIMMINIMILLNNLKSRHWW